MTPHTFLIGVNSELLVEVLAPTYATWVTESKKDDDIFGSPQDALAEANYPELAQLIKTPSLLELVIGHYLLHDFLGKLTWNEERQIEYWLDTVSSCHIEGHLVYLSGTCYSSH